MTARTVVLDQVASLGTAATVMPYARNVGAVTLASGPTPTQPARQSFRMGTPTKQGA